MNLYRLNRALHRDLGYLFFGMTIIYAVSGIALNHRHHWNPNYIITHDTINVDLPAAVELRNRDLAIDILASLPGQPSYRTHISTASEYKIFLDGGSLTFDPETGEGRLETIRRRRVFYEFNLLHYNRPQRLWTWFSDLYAIGLFTLAVTGLFIIKGRNGIKGRGAWLTAVGVAIPLLLFLIYL